MGCGRKGTALPVVQREVTGPLPAGSPWQPTRPSAGALGRGGTGQGGAVLGAPVEVRGAALTGRALCFPCPSGLGSYFPAACDESGLLRE